MQKNPMNWIELLQEGPNRAGHNLGEQSIGFGFAKPDDEGMGLDMLGKSLSRLETSRATPPLFFQLYFLLRLKMSEIRSNSLIMLGKAFRGNGFIHLNIVNPFRQHNHRKQNTSRCTFS